MANIVNKAGTNVGNGYKLIGASPLDVRLVVADIAERNSIVDANGCYPGLEVWVESEKKKYRAVPTSSGYTWKETSLFEDISNKTITLTAGNGLTDGGDFTLNQSSNETITFNVGAGEGITVNTDSVAHSVPTGASATSYGPSNGGEQAAKGTLDIIVPQITTDKFGHITSVTNKTFKVTDTDEDTGATSVETVGDGNAVTTASYSADTRKLTLTKGNTFVDLATNGQTITGSKTFNNTLTLAVGSAGKIIKHTNSGSNYVATLMWYKGDKATSGKDYDAHIGWHNTGDGGTGLMVLSPTATVKSDDGDPWDKNVGLAIGKSVFKYYGKDVATQEWVTNQLGSGGDYSLDNYVDKTTAQTITGTKTFKDVPITIETTAAAGTVVNAINVTTSTRPGTPMKIIPYSKNGTGIILGDGGIFLAGSGESAFELWDKVLKNTTGVHGGSENTFITSDGSIYLVSNCNAIADRQQVEIGGSGIVIAPGGFEHFGLTADTGKTKNDYVLLAGGGTKAISEITGTTYDADRGISLVDNKFGHSNTTVTAVTTAGLYKIKYDAYGHITGTESVTLPDPSGYYWANVQISDTSSTETSPTVKNLSATTVKIGNKATWQYNSSTDCVELAW